MNSSFNKLLTFKILIVVLMISVFCTNFLFIEKVDALSDSKQLVLDAWTLVNEGFYDPEKFDEIQWKRIRQKTLQKQIETSEEAYSAIEDMLRPLDDPFTRVLRPKDYELLKSSNFGSEINGVGLQLGEDEDSNKIKVVSTLGGSPAEEAGITSGSLIEKVDGISSEELGLANTASKLRGESGTKVLVEISSESGEIKEVDLERRPVDLRPVRTKRLRDDSHTIGYLRITQFSESVPKKVEEALQELKEKEVEGLILDLRNNSGGLVSSGIAVADSLLSEKPVVETKDRNGIKDAIISQKETSFDGPMVTLVNKGTASASEILAGSLQDNERSILMGEQTYGKGLIQSLKSLGEDSGIAVTVASYLTPKGNNIQGQGMTPDKLLDLPDASEYGSTDDKWVRNAELFLGSLLEKEEVSVQTIDLNNEGIKS
ncbi:carboxyl-terminal processing protease CtpZ [Prochlorococcus marinus]|uniref:carboxyl-terminal processing protease CtpZ n=1 Tax=Prochlorococcus marinus TaxID=1219 RepID=UPI001ADC3079|nr:carboxyl-terminal processing protease CtpZ [Prochlorococcus marinus]MBO8220398.1 peptidase S41 [Prochlorococcus marinus CUG1417]MBW3075031.1 peptidase S41 [Prochlorococcus marinus str. MU1417]